MFYMIGVQEVWQVSTTAAGRRGGKKGLSMHEASASSSHPTKESEVSSKQSASAVPFSSSTSQLPADSLLVSFQCFFCLFALDAISFLIRKKKKSEFSKEDKEYN